MFKRLKRALAPVRILDKNGKATTVYRRGSDTVDEPVTLPKPAFSLPSEADIKESRTRRISEEVIFLTGAEGDSADEAERIYTSLQEYSTEFLKKVDRLLLVSDTANDVAANDAALLIKDGYSEGSINEVLKYREVAGIPGFYQSMRLVQTLDAKNYPGLPESDDYSKADDAVQSQCNALLKVTGAIWNHVGESRGALKNLNNVPVIADSRLVTLVLEHHEDADVITSLIRDRKTADFDVIDGVLNSASTPLSSGSL